MSKSEAKLIVKKYGILLKKSDFIFSEIYLFGSYATGKATKNSDIDVAVVTSGKRDKKYLKQKMRLWEIAVEVDSRLEPVLLSKDDFKKNSVSILADEIKKEGVKIV